MTTRDLDKLTGAEQIHVMGALSQAAAAWLAGVSGRTLRDHAGVPRDEAGRYGGRDVVAWAAGRQKRASLDDDQVEQLLLIAEELSTASCLAAIVEVLRELKAAHGDAGLLAFAVVMFEVWADLIEARPGQGRPPTIADRRASVAAWQQAEDERAAYAELRVAVVCEACGRIRRGRSWTKSKPPAGWAVMKSVCERCEAKL